MPAVALGDIEMHYEERGAGRPLLLVPGIPAIASDWAPLAEPLSASRRVIAYDNRGSGATTVTAAPYTTAGLAADAVALLDALEIERADVFGMSLGGMIAQELALGWPERVDRLVLGCTHCGLAHAEPPEREAGRAFAMETDDWAERMTALAPFAFAPGVDADFLARFIAKKSADVQAARGLPGPDRRGARARQLRPPARARPAHPDLTGDSDRVIPGASSDVLHERIPGSRLEVVAGAGHLFFLERPEETLRLLRRVPALTP